MNLKQVTIISGKGGTGKTTITASLAALSGNSVVADCDVDAANLHLLLKPEIRKRHSFSGSSEAQINEEICTGCGICRDHCRFDAVKSASGKKFFIDALSCEGCAVCYHVCPDNAVHLTPRNTGEWFISETAWGPMVHARLRAAEENSGKLVSEVRKEARRIAEKTNRNLVLIDGPPGIGCPVIASLSGSDTALIVTESTVAAQHDLERILKTAGHFRIFCLCCLNKADLNPDIAQNIEEMCREKSIPLIGKIPYDEAAGESIIMGQPLVENSSGPAAAAIRAMWKELLHWISKENRNEQTQN